MVFIVVLSFILVASVSGLYFHIDETDKKCFIEVIPEETVIVGNFKSEIYYAATSTFLPASPGLGIYILVKDPQNKELFSGTYPGEGRFTFTSYSPGQHQICLNRYSSAWYGDGMIRVHLDIQVDEHANDNQSNAGMDG
ncbi:transmembrane emp24 domain-containing protein 9-like [Tubulanus polymorphus]|uniref:transmembrane emp24 domain-containing protein 9-like n=1 Tax=Tubulanus polymorphus TaxID=672921 RepID=UPI003DA5BB0F